jgi:hypothetical protein
MVVRCTGACLYYNNVSFLATLRLWTSEHPLNLFRLNFCFQLRVIYPYMHKYEPRLKYTIHKVQSAI